MQLLVASEEELQHKNGSPSLALPPRARCHLLHRWRKPPAVKRCSFYYTKWGGALLPVHRCHVYLRYNG